MQLDLGYCHGLTLLWLYKMSEKKIKWYYDLVQKIVDTPTDKLEDIELDIEKFIAHIEWLQQPEKYIPYIRQMDMDKTVEILKEIPVSSVFETKQLDAVLDLVISSEKMICVTGLEHSIGVFRRDSQYYIYNPNYDAGIGKRVDTIAALRIELVKCLFTDFHLSRKKMAITINVLGEDVRERLEIYKWIIESTGIMTFCDYGIGPLYLACENNNEELAKVLLEKGAVPNKPSSSNKYPLVLASYSGYTKLVALLLKNGANPNLEGREGLSLYLACKHGHEEVIKLLLHHGAEVNKPDADGETAIFASINTSRKKLTALLLEQKADPLHARKDGDTAMDIAIRKKDWEIVALMLRFVERPHARNLKTLGYHTKELMLAAKKITDEKLIEPRDSKKIAILVEKITTKKKDLTSIIKSPEHNRRGNIKRLSVQNRNGLFSSVADKIEASLQVEAKLTR